MRSGILRFSAVLATSVTLSACASMPSPSDRIATAYATITSSSGLEWGTAEIWQDRDRIVHVDARLSELPPGPHGVHFHAVGKCDATGTTPFASAGAHFNPIGRAHGLDNSAGPHAGDAPNFTVNADRTGRITFTTDRVSLTEGSTSILDADGSAMVIHASADDQTSQPAGNSGGRIACGVVKQAP